MHAALFDKLFMYFRETDNRFPRCHEINFYISCSLCLFLFIFPILFSFEFPAGTRMRPGQINSTPVHQQVFQCHATLAHIRRQPQIHGILMHHGIKDNRIMHIQPLQVIKAIRALLAPPLMAIKRMVYKANKWAVHRHPNSINQRIQRHRKFWLIHCCDRPKVAPLHWSRGVYAIRFTIYARKPCPIVAQKNIAIGTDSHLSCRWFGFHFTRISW